MLAGYSIDAMNAVIMSGNFVCIFTFMFMGIANAAEIFVGQYNGAKQYEKLAAPTWQMIYLSLITNIISLPIAYFSDSINMLPSYYLNDGVVYQKTLMYFSMIPPIRVALSAFFIGQGKTKIVTLAITIGAVTHVILDYFLIYGIKNVIPSMGCRGAAIALIVAESFQIAILATLFFSKDNREKYKTLENFKLNKKLFIDCLRIGMPISLGNCTSMIAWYILQTTVNHISKDMATIYNMGINVYCFFLFIGKGANKAVAAICSNMIGRGDLESIEKTRRIFIAISLAFGGIIAIPLIIFPKWILNILNMLPDNISPLYPEIKTVFFLVVIIVVLETLLLSHWGILIAGGDSKYAATIYQIFLWLLFVFPSIILYYMNLLTSIPLIYVFIGIWLIATQFFIYKRYKSMKWYNKIV
jgi:MATE family multidrug resistance protein